MSKRELIEIFRKYKSDNEVYHDLMSNKVREILLVATIYDAFTLEQDGFFSEMIFGEYYQLNLTNAPRITNVSSLEDAQEKLKTRRFDLIIVMSRISRLDTCELSRQIKSSHPEIPILLLLNDNAQIGAVDQNRELFPYFDNVFVWNGNSEIFLAMVKYVEDIQNVANDTQIGQVRVILLVEDSIRYYSRYLPLLYSEVIRQTQQLLTEEHHDEMIKVLRMRGRPKVLLASNYENAMVIIEKYQDHLLCVISDIKYPMGGQTDEEAGLKLAKTLKKEYPDLPVLLQSSDSHREPQVKETGVGFINKTSDTLAAQLTNFFYQSLGFGDFVFKTKTDQEIARASTLEQLKDCLRWIPEESLLLHASRNHFSTWLMARGEIQTAQVVFKIKVESFKDAEELRSFLINIGDWVKKIKTRGKVISFDEDYLVENSHICRLAEGSLGGKGRGIAFLNYLLSNSELSRIVPDVLIKIPQTAIIGIDEFSHFIKENQLTELVASEKEYGIIKQRFLNASLSKELKEKLTRFLGIVNHPLAVRSSGLLEDSVSHPLSGLYETFFLPNNHPDLNVRLQQLTEAVKLVYASVYSKAARSYFEAIDYKIEEERMAVVIQQVVGKHFNNRFYPEISGVAQSFNFYPFSYLKPEDGVALLALGLGKYVVGGERSFRFCPSAPQLEILEPQDQVKFSQKQFYALDLTRNTTDLLNSEDATLVTLNLADALADSSISRIASTWNHYEDCFELGVDAPGPKVLNFAGPLLYETVPVAKVVDKVLELVEESMETPVEIEFAMDLEPEDGDRPSFYLLQIKHLLRDNQAATIDIGSLSPDSLMLLSNKGMGNGVNDEITDIIWIDPNFFDKSKTVEMAAEIDSLNDRLKVMNRKYVLLGPGRWGTRDRWLGIPVTWPQISNAQIIVEYSMEGFQIDASLGSHFFHNVTSLNIGYFTVMLSDKSFIAWDWLRSFSSSRQNGFFRHTSFQNPVKIVMDGRKGVFAIYKGENSHE